MLMNIFISTKLFSQYFIYILLIPITNWCSLFSIFQEPNPIYRTDHLHHTWEAPAQPATNEAEHTLEEIEPASRAHHLCVRAVYSSSSSHRPMPAAVQLNHRPDTWAKQGGGKKEGENFQGGRPRPSVHTFLSLSFSFTPQSQVSAATLVGWAEAAP